MMKVMFGCGLYAAFRGSAEHTYFSRSQVKRGIYPSNFENPNLAGHRYIAIDNMPRDKTSKITVNNSYARDMSNLMRFPIVENDPDNFGGALDRLFEKLSPGQVRMYCKPATAVFKLGLVEKGYPNAEFYPETVLGEKKIATLFQKGAEILGLPSDFKPHSLRGACITMLANDSSVSMAETMRVARHNSVSASKVYQRVDGISETNRLKALGQSLPVESLSPVNNKNKIDDCDGDDDDVSMEFVPLRSRVTNKSEDGIEFMDEDSTMLGDDYNDLVEEYAQLKNQLVTACRIRGGAGNSLTQMGIDELKGDIEDLKDQLKTAHGKKKKKKPAISENRVEIEKLKAIVRSLKQRLEDQELYSGSLEHDLDVRVKELEKELKMERKLRKKLQ